jgi:hypothetical protein
LHRRGIGPRGGRCGVGVRPKPLLGLLLLIVGGSLFSFAVARAIYYPFWAAGASEDEPSRSWGGPSAIGATSVHWLVALALAAVAVFLVQTGNRWRRRSND